MHFTQYSIIQKVFSDLYIKNMPNLLLIQNGGWPWHDDYILASKCPWCVSRPSTSSRCFVKALPWCLGANIFYFKMRLTEVKSHIYQSNHLFLEQDLKLTSVARNKEKSDLSFLSSYSISLFYPTDIWEGGELPYSSYNPQTKIILY